MWQLPLYQPVRLLSPPLILYLPGPLLSCRRSLWGISPFVLFLSAEASRWKDPSNRSLHSSYGWRWRPGAAEGNSITLKGQLPECEDGGGRKQMCYVAVWKLWKKAFCKIGTSLRLQLLDFVPSWRFWFRFYLSDLPAAPQFGQRVCRWSQQQRFHDSFSWNIDDISKMWTTITSCRCLHRTSWSAWAVILATYTLRWWLLYFSISCKKKSFFDPLVICLHMDTSRKTTSWEYQKMFPV